MESTSGENTAKSLGNSDVNGARQNVPDIVVFGDGDTFKLICKASSQREGWMKSTKAMEIAGVGCVVQVTTQQRNPDGSYALAEALTFVPGAVIVEHRDGENGPVYGREILPSNAYTPPGVPYSYDPAREARGTALHVLASVHRRGGVNATTLIYEAQRLAAFIEGKSDPKPSADQFTPGKMVPVDRS